MWKEEKNSLYRKFEFKDFSEAFAFMTRVAIEAENGRAALELVERRRPNLILLDLMMPEMDGFQFLDELRRSRAWADIPVIVLTAKDLTPQDHVRLSGNVERILAKGAYTRDEMLAELHRLVVEYMGKPRPRPARAGGSGAAAVNPIEAARS